MRTLCSCISQYVVHHVSGQPVCVRNTTGYIPPQLRALIFLSIAITIFLVTVYRSSCSYVISVFNLSQRIWKNKYNKISN
jgi:hypothetical protein